MAKRISILLIVAVCLLVALGLTMLASTSYHVQEGRGEDYFTLRKQIAALGIGVLACGFFALLDYNQLLRWRWHIFAGAAAVLALVLVPGVGVMINGASRWIGTGMFRAQPSEIAKIALAIALAAWFATHESETATLLRWAGVPVSA